MKLKSIMIVMAALVYANCCLAACAPKGKKTETRQSVEKPVCSEWIHPDSIAYSNLGKRLTDVLINANKVRVYSLRPKEKVTADDVEIEPHFVRDTQLATLTKEQAVVLKYSLISCGANYSKDTLLVPMSPYCPEIEFEFTKKKEVAHVFISLVDGKWGVRYDGKTQFKYNYRDGVLLHRFCRFFLKNKKK